LLLLSVERFIELLDCFEHFLEVARDRLGKVAELLLVDELSFDRGIVFLELFDLCFLGSSLGNGVLSSLENFGHLIERVSHRIGVRFLGHIICKLADFHDCLLDVKNVLFDLLTSLITFLLDLIDGSLTLGLRILDNFLDLSVIMVWKGSIFLVRLSLEFDCLLQWLILADALLILDLVHSSLTHLVGFDDWIFLLGSESVYLA
jgi:hypothetical protein